MENSWTSAASCRRLQGLHAEHGVRWRGLSCSFIGGPTMIGCSTIKDRSCTSLPFQLYLVPVLRQLYANRSATRLKIEERAALLDQLKIGRCSTHLVFLNGDELWSWICLIVACKTIEQPCRVRRCRDVDAEKNGGKNRSVRGRRIDEERKMATRESRQRELTKKGEGSSRKGMKEQSKGAQAVWNGWLGERWVSEV